MRLALPTAALLTVTRLDVRPVKSVDDWWKEPSAA